MYGNLALLDDSGKFESGERVYLTELKGKDESWLRDTLFDHPEIIPITEIDPTFGPLVPLCKELRTDVGPIDAVFINERGRLTIVECKLWKNPEARQQVVAQTLDYVSALSGWMYADLQRQVAIARNRHGNIPFEVVRDHTTARIREPEFIDAVSRSLREGRFLILLVGDGIREGIQSLTELVNRNATKAFTFGIVEFATYRFGKNRFAVQPRILAETEMLMRHLTIVNMNVEETDEQEQIERDTSDAREYHDHFWKPLLRMKFDDPEQDTPIYIPATYNLSLRTPYPGIRIKAYAQYKGDQIGVFLSETRAGNLDTIIPFIKRNRRYLAEHLPPGTEIDPRNYSPIFISTKGNLSDDQRRTWLAKNLNSFVNVLRPSLRKWYEETRA
jgi:hypothetical protein